MWGRMESWKASASIPFLGNRPTYDRSRRGFGASYMHSLGSMARSQMHTFAMHTSQSRPNATIPRHDFPEDNTSKGKLWSILYKNHPTSNHNVIHSSDDMLGPSAVSPVANSCMFHESDFPRRRDSASSALQTLPTLVIGKLGQTLPKNGKICQRNTL